MENTVLVCVHAKIDLCHILININAVSVCELWLG